MAALHAHHMYRWRPAAMQNSIHGVTLAMQLTHKHNVKRHQPPWSSSTCKQQHPADVLLLPILPPGQQWWLHLMTEAGQAECSGCLDGRICQLHEQDTRRNNVWNLTGCPIWRCSKLEGWRNPELGPNPGRAVPLGTHAICSHLLSLSCRFRNMLTAFAATSWGRLYAQRNARHPNCISNSRNESMPLATALLKTVNKKYRGECIIQKQQASPSEIRIHLKSS